ncbi:methyl-accepting chemotaxis sensory transducer [[Enterobacter] lignolyticus SCF1]|uniref:Methyl-accepting chemotaxis sensory transducer n=2 Tax=[Enterobacter] lignolyticus TaxID=1334193 RepID=E3G9B5_ENTLS|nr:methyl-accepting chemotaxis sensory transducer [[Enterobacter] lignolyticus SCF1]
MKISSFLLNLKTGKKLTLGFVIIIVLMIVILLTSILGLKNIQDKVTKGALSVQLINALFDTRLNRTYYQYTSEARYLQKNGEAVDRMMVILNELKAMSWSGKGQQLLLDTEEAVSNYIRDRAPFNDAVGKRYQQSQLLNSERLIGESRVFDGLSENGALSAEQKLQAAQLGFILNDIDSMLTDFKTTPTPQALAGAKARLEEGMARTKLLLPALSDKERATGNSVIVALSGFISALEPYRSAWLAVDGASVTLLARANELTQAINTLHEFQEQTVESIVVSVEWQMQLVALIGIIIGIVLACVITRAITRPLNATLLMAENIAQGDLTQTLESQRQDEIGKLMQAMSLMNRNLKNIIHDVREGIASVARSSTEIAAGNVDLSSRTEQQAAAVVETAASMEELTSTVALNAENAGQARRLSEQAAQKAAQGCQVSQSVIETMRNVQGSAHRISEITTVINGIAFQTNILALNAAVEAARAGEQGKGFAVVAGEVRNLASRSAQSAKEIESLIQESVGYVDTGFRLVEQAGSAMADIETSVAQVRDIMSEIASATDEQSRGITQIAQAMSEMDTTTQQNAALVEESSAAANSLEEQALKLEEAVSVFRVSDDTLLTPGSALHRPTPGAAAKAPVKRQEEGWTTF